MIVFLTSAFTILVKLGDNLQYVSNCFKVLTLFCLCTSQTRLNRTLWNHKNMFATAMILLYNHKDLCVKSFIWNHMSGYRCVRYSNAFVITVIVITDFDFKPAIGLQKTLLSTTKCSLLTVSTVLS